MPPDAQSQFERRKTFEGKKAFDGWQLKRLVDKDVPDDVVKALQASCGDNLTQAVDQYFAMEEAKKRASDSQIRNGDKATNDSAEGTSENRKAIYERHQYWDKEQLRWRLKKAIKTGMHVGRYVLFVRRVYSEKMVYSHTAIQVKGKVLRNALRNIFRGAEGFTLTQDESVELDDQRFFYWARVELQLLARHFRQLEDSQSLFEIEAGLQFIQTEWSQTQAALDSLLPTSISFKNLWAIFPPDCLVVGKDPLSGNRIWRSRSAVEKRTDNGIIFVISAESIDWNGKNLGLVRSQLTIDDFSGTLAIGDLPYAPLRYHPRAKVVMQRILERSQKKLTYCSRGFQIRDHEGLGLTTRVDPQGRRVVGLHSFGGRIMVDPQMMRQVEPEDPLNYSLNKFRNVSRVWMSDLSSDEKTILDELLKSPEVALTAGSEESNDSSVDDSDSDDSIVYEFERAQKKRKTTKTLTDEEKFLLSGHVLGYCLSDDKWGAFSIDHVSEVDWDSTVFDSLVMDKPLKDVIYRLVQAHRTHVSTFDDFVKGKGKGLIGLLLGPPGSGKTLTAEAIAETAHMPLYMVSSGALGSDPQDIYTNLTKILELATHWNAVLLLDEADVFLARRNPTDLQRNAIVSVFLRELEYYQGVLILTTNQAQIIDDAFQSRIHFCHHYKTLDFVARRQVWQNFMNRAKHGSQGINVEVNDRGIDELAKLPLNGRQIKNATSIAMNLATTDKTRTVTAESIIATAAALQNFNFETEESIDQTPVTAYTYSGNNSEGSFGLESVPFAGTQKKPPRPPPPRASKPKLIMPKR